MQIIANLFYRIVFSYIAVTGDLFGCDSYIDCKNFANYIRFLIQNVADEIIIDLNIEKFAIYVNVIEELAIW